MKPLPLLAGILCAAAAFAPHAALAQNPIGMFTPLPPSTPPVLIPGGGNNGGNGGGMGGGGHGGWGHHQPVPYYPPFIYWPYGTFSGGMVTQDVQAQPVNPEPFKPTTPPAFGRQESTKPYAPPSVEIAPGGIEIIRGPG